MTSSFSEQHPWFVRKIKGHYFKLLKKAKVKSIIKQLDSCKMQIYINPADDDVGKFIFFDNYEAETVRFVTKFLSPGDQVLDIGSNIGFFTLLFSSLVGGSGEVHSFEPSLREFFQLCKNASQNHLENVFLNCMAVGRENGYVKMNILDDDRFGAFNSVEEISHRKVKNAPTHIEKVRSIAVDKYISLLPELCPYLIKIDVEGYEKEVLYGMQCLLSSENAPSLILEVCDETQIDKDEGINDLVNILFSFGYHLFSPNKEGNLEKFEPGKSQNCVALKMSNYQRLNDKGILFID